MPVVGWFCRRRLRRGLTAQPQDLDRSVGGLGGGGGSLGEYGAGGNGVRRVGLAVAASGGPVSAALLHWSWVLLVPGIIGMIHLVRRRAVLFGHIAGPSRCSASSTSPR
jgi:hypothetical protein